MIEGVKAKTPGLVAHPTELADERASALLGADTARADRRPWKVWIGRTLAVVLPATLWFVPLALDLTAKHALAIALFMIIAWITEALPHAITGLVGCYLFWILGVVKFNVAFSGFSTDTPWFYFGALLFGLMATKSGLARRLAYLVMLRVGNSYSRILLGLIILSFMLTFLIPSGTACVVIMAAIALGLLDAYGFGPGSNIGRGMFITLTYTAGMFDKMVIAGPASILGRGLIEKSAHIEVLWSKWMLAYLPLGIITIFATWRLVLWLYPPEKRLLAGGSGFLKDELKKMGPWSAIEKHALVLMLLALALWMTDFIHHIPPSMIGLGVGLFATLPRLGILNTDDVKSINYLSIIFVAAAISLGEVLIQTKALDLITNVMFAWMAPLVKNVFSLSVVPYWTAFTYHLFLGTDVSMLSTSIPPLMNFATANHLNPLMLGMIWTFAAGGKIFVYQSAVMIVGYSYGHFEARDMLRVGICLTIIESILLLILVPLYWPLLGIG